MCQKNKSIRWNCKHRRKLKFSDYFLSGISVAQSVFIVADESGEGCALFLWKSFL